MVCDVWLNRTEDGFDTMDHFLILNDHDINLYHYDISFECVNILKWA